MARCELVLFSPLWFRANHDGLWVVLGEGGGFAGHPLHVQLAVHDGFLLYPPHDGPRASPKHEPKAALWAQPLRPFIVVRLFPHALLDLCVGQKGLGKQCPNRLGKHGHEFAFDCVKLLLADLRFFILDFDSFQTEATRIYVIDPQMSDRRIERLIGLLPSFTKQSRVAISGSIDFLQESRSINRTNIDGSKDAICPQDSLFYPIISACSVL